MNIEILLHQGVKVVYLSGDIDMHSSPALRKELLTLVSEKAPVLIADFGGAAYIDSSGIATFVEILKCVKSYGGELKLTRIPPRIAEIFSFSRLDKVFALYESLDDAVRG